MIELREPREPVSPDVLADVERRLAEAGHHIPPSYRAFLAEHDGGRPVRNTFTFAQHEREASSRVQSFLAAGDEEYGLVATVGRNGDIPPGILPIAGDEFGNYVCIDARDDADGPVLFWDHEEGFDDDEVDFSNLYEVAPDLQTFLDGLTAPAAPPEPEGRRGGLGRLFGRK
jgi:cell wall assembly regulator SMI1